MSKPAKNFAPPPVNELDELAAAARLRFSNDPAADAIPPDDAVTPSHRHDGTTAERQAVTTKNTEDTADRQTSKFTVLLDTSDAASFDELALALRRRLGRRIGKADILRGLLALVEERPEIVGQLAEHLPTR